MSLRIIAAKKKCGMWMSQPMNRETISTTQNVIWFVDTMLFLIQKTAWKYDKSTAKPTQHNNIIKQFRINNTMDKLCYCYTLLQMENQPFVDDFPWFSHAFSTSMQPFTLGYMMEWIGIHAYIYVCVCVYICIKANGWYKYTNIEPLVSIELHLNTYQSGVIGPWVC